MAVRVNALARGLFAGISRVSRPEGYLYPPSGTLQGPPSRKWARSAPTAILPPSYAYTRSLSHKAPGRDLVPEPKPPARMVVEAPPAPKGLRGLIRKMFEGKNPGKAPFADSEKHPLHLEGSDEDVHSTAATPKFLHTDKTTNLLYWYCTDLVFAKSDFERIGPPGVNFTVTRARNPVNLTRWMGYFLKFDSVESAVRYFEHTLGHELCGFPLKLRFTQPEIQGFKSPILTKTDLPRQAHVLMLGLPLGLKENIVLRALWDYDLLDDDLLAVERMPMGSVQYGGNPILLRFKTEKEAARFVRDYNGEVFPYTDSKVLCEVVD